jgi:hypothetical protein
MKIEPVTSFENLACDFGSALSTVFPDGLPHHALFAGNSPCRVSKYFASFIS